MDVMVKCNFLPRTLLWHERQNVLSLCNTSKERHRCQTIHTRGKDIVRFFLCIRDHRCVCFCLVYMSVLENFSWSCRDKLQGDAKKERPIKIFLPFSEGARNCVGLSLAKVNMAATLATLLSNFSIRLAPEVGSTAPVFSRERRSLLSPGF